ncbi:MAG: hypothetical protein MRY63_03380 [Neomegalonema sp.]|nr:hypothetical protein [Neomegalonema sp.]
MKAIASVIGAAVGAMILFAGVAAAQSAGRVECRPGSAKDRARCYCPVGFSAVTLSNGTQMCEQTRAVRCSPSNALSSGLQVGSVWYSPPFFLSQYGEKCLCDTGGALVRRNDGRFACEFGAQEVDCGSGFKDLGGACFQF